MISFRDMKPADIPAGLSLCRAAGWNQLSRDWELFLHLSPEGCRVAVDDSGKMVGTVTTVNYQNHFSWIGMVLVDPDCRKQGIGLQLLKESLNVLRHEGTVKLDATPAGREIYLKLNFVDEYPLKRMMCDKVSARNFVGTSAKPAQPDDFPAILEFDREVFGADRTKVLQQSWKDSPQHTWVTASENKITGYCFGRQGYHYTHIGPVVAQDSDLAIQLVSAALQNCLATPVILDAADHTPAWSTWLSSLGFIEQRPFIRMFRGSNTWPGVPEKQFAILGPEFG